jgi:hypothetical protein
MPARKKRLSIDLEVNLLCAHQELQEVALRGTPQQKAHLEERIFQLWEEWARVAFANNKPITEDMVPWRYRVELFERILRKDAAARKALEVSHVQ